MLVFAAVAKKVVPPFTGNEQGGEKGWQVGEEVKKEEHSGGKQWQWTD